MIQEYKFTISKIIDEAPEVKTFRLEVPNRNNLIFLPGQFFLVWFENEPSVKRSYSIASSPTENDHLDITMNLVGKFTNKLFQKQIGDQLIIKGPIGKFYFTEEMKYDLVLIGGGLGIVPLMSILRYHNAKKLPNNIILIYSARTPDLIVYKNELENLSKINPNFTFIPTITRPDSQQWDGRIGRISQALLKENIKNPENSLCYICGPKEFIASTVEILKYIGIPDSFIKIDRWNN